ncbi:MAG: META domain-containing protein [Robiginitalea sp.]|uniref:META domain-containing protein n=1 Tax=Robiginitalea sp. TaxID=1902411 RepID=UPI003C76C168
MSPKTVQLVFFLSLFVFFGCAPIKDTKNTESPSPVSDVEAAGSESSNPLKAMDINEYYFMASGISPDWTLDIATDRIRLKTGGDTLNTPHINPDRAMDSNVRRYRLITEATEMTIQVHQKPCESESGTSSPYAVEVEYKRTGESGYTTLNGCGAYIMDYRLHDIWALESLNGEEITLIEGLERPTLEINSRNYTFMGSTSCNQMRGAVFYEPGLLRFNKVITTRKMCPGGLEAAFLKALQSTIHYELGDRRLRLTNPNGAELVFRKVD